MGKRILAYILDTAIVWISASIIVAILPGDFLDIVLVMPFVIFYHLFCEINYRGQSIGKRIVKIRVISTNGQLPTLNDYMIRWLFRLVDIMASFGGVACLIIFASEKRQRIGDFLAQTVVVDLEEDQRVNLKMLEELDNIETELLYPKVVMYTDKEMLLLKNTIYRYKSKPNDATKQVLLDLVDRIASDLGVSTKDIRKLEFLEKVLYDYVVQTR